MCILCVPSVLTINHMCGGEWPYSTGGVFCDILWSTLVVAVLLGYLLLVLSIMCLLCGFLFLYVGGTDYSGLVLLLYISPSSLIITTYYCLFLYYGMCDIIFWRRSTARRLASLCPTLALRALVLRYYYFLLCCGEEGGDCNSFCMPMLFFREDAVRMADS